MIPAGRSEMEVSTVSDADTPRPDAPESRNPISTRAVIGSVLAAAFGVQSSRNRERDFSQGSYRHFVIAGIVFTVLFVLTLVAVVRVVLS